MDGCIAVVGCTFIGVEARPLGPAHREPQGGGGKQGEGPTRWRHTGEDPT
jgi:hypothetical protein